MSGLTRGLAADLAEQSARSMSRRSQPRARRQRKPIGWGCARAAGTRCAVWMERSVLASRRYVRMHTCADACVHVCMPHGCIATCVRAATSGSHATIPVSAPYERWKTCGTWRRPGADVAPSRCGHGQKDVGGQHRLSRRLERRAVEDCQPVPRQVRPHGARMDRVDIHARGVAEQLRTTAVCPPGPAPPRPPRPAPPRPAPPRPAPPRPTGMAALSRAFQ